LRNAGGCSLCPDIDMTHVQGYRGEGLPFLPGATRHGKYGSSMNKTLATAAPSRSAVTTDRSVAFGAATKSH
jgi:hypothetical protein